MEEQSTVQTLTIFIRSNQIQELRIDIYDSFDTLITNFNILNYNTHTVHLKNQLRRFYCIVTNPEHSIEEQFQVKINQDQGNKSTFQYSKKFKAFIVNIQIEEKKLLEKVLVFSKFIKEQSQFTKFANNHLRKLQNNVFKKMQVEQLKKPLTKRHHQKTSNGIRKYTKNYTHKKLPKENEKKILAKKTKNLQLTFKSLSKPKQHRPSQSSQLTDESIVMSTVKQVETKRKKHNTLFEQNQLRKTEMSIKEVNQEQKQNDDYYSQFLKALDYSSNKNKAAATSRIRKKRPQNQLQLSTTMEIERQKKAFQVIKTMKGLYSHQNSPVKIANTSSMKAVMKRSPYYILNSSAFLKRKVK